MSTTPLIKPSTKGNDLQKVLQSKGDVGIPKVTKKSPTRPQGFNLSSAKKRKDSPNAEVPQQKAIKSTLIQTPKFAKMTKPTEVSKENLKPKGTPMPLKKLEPKTQTSKPISINTDKNAVQNKVGKNPIPKIPVFSSVTKPKPHEKKPIPNIKPQSPSSPIQSVSTLKQKLKEAEDKVLDQQKEISILKIENQELKNEIEKLKNPKVEQVVEHVEQEVEQEKNLKIELFPKDESINLEKVEDDDFVHSPFGSSDDLKENQPPIEALDLVQNLKRNDQKDRVVLAEKTDYEIDKRDDIIVEEDEVPEKQVVVEKEEEKKEEIKEEEKKEEEIAEEIKEIVREEKKEEEEEKKDEEEIVKEEKEEKEIVEKKEKKDDEEEEKNVDNEERISRDSITYLSPKPYQTPKRKRQKTLRKKNQDPLELEN